MNEYSEDECDNSSPTNMAEYISAEILSGAKNENLQHHSNWKCLLPHAHATQTQLTVNFNLCHSRIQIQIQT